MSHKDIEERSTGKSERNQDIFSFGRGLLETKDLDPVYVLLWEGRIEPLTLCRWLLAYWCFYDMGTSSWISQSSGGESGYWERMEIAAASKQYRRGHERRHFRGGNGEKSIQYLKERGLQSLFEPLVGAVCEVDYIMEVVQTWTGFGPWIAFKVADMLERLYLATIQFTNATPFLFDSPREGAIRLWREVNGDIPIKSIPKVCDWAIKTILDSFSQEKSPPRYERGLNVQEAETILCKWKSHLNGHYEVGEDIRACKESLLRFPRVGLSQQLLKAGRKVELW